MTYIFICCSGFGKSFISKKNKNFIDLDKIPLDAKIIYEKKEFYILDFINTENKYILLNINNIPINYNKIGLKEYKIYFLDYINIIDLIVDRIFMKKKCNKDKYLGNLYLYKNKIKKKLLSDRKKEIKSLYFRNIKYNTIKLTAEEFNNLDYFISKNFPIEE